MLTAALLSSNSLPPVAPITALTVAAPAPTTVQPVDNPALPGWAAVWNPTFTGSVGGSAPQIGMMTRQAARGQTAAIAGYALNSDIAFDVYGQTTTFNQAFLTATRLYRNTDRAAIAMPSGLPALGMHVVWPKNSNGYGAAFLVNQTDARYLQTSTTGGQDGVAGDTVYVVGQNLFGPAGNCGIYLTPTPGGGQYISPTTVTPYKVTFTIPAGLASTGTSSTSLTVGLGSTGNITTQSGLGFAVGQGIVLKNTFSNPIATDSTMTGTVTSYSGTTLVVNVTSRTGGGSGGGWYIQPTYEVWLHNGYGGNLGWSMCPQQLTVTNLATVYRDYSGFSANLSDYGGVPNTGADQSAAFNAAVADLTGNGHTGITLNLAAGVYTINSGIKLGLGGGQSICLKGAGKTTTTIRCSTGFAVNDHGSAIHTTGVDRLSDFTLDMDTNPTGGKGVTGFFSLINVKIPGAVSCPICWSPNTGDNRLVCSGCEFHGQPIFFQDSNNILVINSDFYGSNRAGNNPDSLLTMWGGYQVTVTGCTGQNNGAYVGRFAVLALIYNTGNHYIGDNTINLPLPNSDGSDGEQILIESGGLNGAEAEDIVSATVTGGVTVLTLGALTSDVSGLNAFITAGKGAGQFANITKANVGAKTLTLDRALRITPDAGSPRVNCGGSPLFHVAYNNTQTGGPYHNAMWSSFVGGAELICDGNHINSCQYGVELWTSTVAVQGSNCAMPAFFCMIQNNTISASSVGLRLPADGGVESETALFLGNIFRNITIGSATEAAVAYEVTDGQQADLTIIEACTGTNTPLAIEEAGAPSPGATLLVYGSAFSLGSATFSGSKAKSGTSGFTVSDLGGTTYTGFQA